MLHELTDENGRTKLHHAALEGDATVARLLLDEGADVNATDRWGRTPLFIATFEEPLVEDRLPTVRLLLDRGADVNARDESGSTPLHVAAAMGEVEVVDLLIERGADVCAANAIGQLPVDGAERNHERKIIQKLALAAASCQLR